MNFTSQAVRWKSPLILAALVVMNAQVAHAQTEEPRVIGNPPLLELKRKAMRSALVTAAPRAAAGVENEASLDLNIIYTDGKIWNPAVQRFDQVRLRSYQGTRVDPNAPFVSPMLEINPGDTIRINLNNKLPADPSCIKWDGDVNIPHCFNGTNLHSHGLWVNPAGNSDNVLISINPGVSFQYEYNVPSDHLQAHSGITRIGTARQRCRCLAVWQARSSFAATARRRSPKTATSTRS
jgi:L-ascorbate oxidase